MCALCIPPAAKTLCTHTHAISSITPKHGRHLMQRNHLPHTEQGSQQLHHTRLPSGPKHLRALQTARGHGKVSCRPAHSPKCKSFVCRVWLIHQDTNNSRQTEQCGATVPTQPLPDHTSRTADWSTIALGTDTCHIAQVTMAWPASIAGSVAVWPLIPAP